MKKVKPIVLELNSEDEQAGYFVNREFDFIPSGMIDPEEYWTNAELVYPSDGKIKQITLDEDITEDEFYDKFIEGKDIYTGLYRCDDYYAEGKCNPDVLYELGIYLVYYNDEYFLNIPATGINYLTEYFVPLFKHLGWIKEEE